MIKDGEQHIASLRDVRQIYIDGELVETHVDHPAFKKSILSAAALYDYQAEPENMNRMTFVSPTTGDRVSRMWQLPGCYGELVERRNALDTWASNFFSATARNTAKRFPNTTNMRAIRICI